MQGLKDTFEYKDGILFWRDTGRKAGYTNKAGYVLINWKGKMLRAHRLIFGMFNGFVPNFLDHINGDKADNRVENLRPATKSQNEWNKVMFKNNTSGVKGVSWHKQRQKWRVYIWANSKQVNLGLFTNIGDAKATMEKHRARLHGVFANNG